MSDDQPPQRSFPLVWVLLGVAVVGLLAVAGALASRDPASLDPTTPEGVTQRYLQAVLTHDFEAARSFLSADLTEDCNLEFLNAYVPEQASITIEEVSEVGGFTEVVIEVTQSFGEPPFDAGNYSSDETIRLARTSTGWEIVAVPWPLYGCPEVRP